VFGARGIDVLAESLVAIVGTGQIRLAGVVREESLGFGKLVNTGMTSPPAATGNALSAIQEILHAQVDIIAHAAPRNLDSIPQCR